MVPKSGSAFRCQHPEFGAGNDPVFRPQKRDQGTEPQREAHTRCSRILTLELLSCCPVCCRAATTHGILCAAGAAERPWAQWIPAFAQLTHHKSQACTRTGEAHRVEITFWLFFGPEIGTCCCSQRLSFKQHLLTKRAACCPVKTREPWYNVNSFPAFRRPSRLHPPVNAK